MFPKPYRLAKKRDIERVFRKGRHGASGFAFINALENRLPHVRLTVIVGTKSKLKAVGRNLLKRRARAYIESIKKDLPTGNDLVVGFKGQFDKVPTYGEIARHLEECLKKLRSAPSGGIRKPYRRTTAR
ncbi:MAG TPA: ribonuclease P protein component [Patescibacteria group bacterium]|nr:ribonuclease P protein component [Patescibacteria group bacterium]